MNRYRDAAALRRGVEDRLAAAAGRDGIDLNRLRRRLVFERVLARLNRDGDLDWVLKGGFLLEARLQSRARATRDLDLAVCAAELDGVAVRDHLIDACSHDPDGDNFLFTVDVPRALRADQAGRPGWRFTLTASLAGKPFASLRVDVVARAEELDGGVEELVLPSLLAFAGVPDVRIRAVDPAQHAAEKLHALARDFANGRVNTRVKDLVDLVLLTDAGLIDPSNVRERLRQVYVVRDGREPPIAPPDPPPQWAQEFATHVEALELSTPDLVAATRMLHDLWRSVCPAHPTIEEKPS